MPVWTEQINKHKIVLPAGISSANNGKIPENLLSDVFNGKGVRIGRLNKPAARSFKAMVRQALLDGIPADQITATDTFRTYASQLNLWNVRYDHTDHGNGGRTCGGDHRFLKDGMATAACPGTSNHGYAGAIDKGNGLAWHAWLEKNAVSYGWEWELKSEKWHLHYWPGDVIPKAVLDSEQIHGHTEENLMSENAVLVHVVEPGHSQDNRVFFIMGNIRNWLEEDWQVRDTKKIFDIDTTHDINGGYFDQVIEPMTATSMTGMRDLPPDRRAQIANIESNVVALNEKVDALTKQ